MKGQRGGAHLRPPLHRLARLITSAIHAPLPGGGEEACISASYREASSGRLHLGAIVAQALRALPRARRGRVLGSVSLVSGGDALRGVRRPWDGPLIVVGGSERKGLQQQSYSMQEQSPVRLSAGTSPRLPAWKFCKFMPAHLPSPSRQILSGLHPLRGDR